jgi:hypothetical protein
MGSEEGEILDDASLTSLSAAGATTAATTYRDGDSASDSQPACSLEVKDTTRAVDLEGSKQSVHQLFPNREWEQSEPEARQTAIGLWQTCSGSVTTQKNFDGALMSSEENYGVVNHSGAVPADDGDAVLGGSEMAMVGGPVPADGKNEDGNGGDHQLQTTCGNLVM